MHPGSETRTLRIVDKAGADALIAHIMETMQSLEAILVEEGSHVRAGRLRQGLSDTERKTALGASYMQGLEVAKANAIALARFARTRSRDLNPRTSASLRWSRPARLSWRRRARCRKAWSSPWPRI